MQMSCQPALQPRALGLAAPAFVLEAFRRPGTLSHGKANSTPTRHPWTSGAVHATRNRWSHNGAPAGSRTTAQTALPSILKAVQSALLSLLESFLVRAPGKSPRRHAATDRAGGRLSGYRTGRKTSGRGRRVSRNTDSPEAPATTGNVAGCSLERWYRLKAEF